jgi:hypothetical protein
LREAAWWKLFHRNCSAESFYGVAV